MKHPYDARKVTSSKQHHQKCRRTGIETLTDERPPKTGGFNVHEAHVILSEGHGRRRVGHDILRCWVTNHIVGFTSPYGIRQRAAQIYCVLVCTSPSMVLFTI